MLIFYQINGKIPSNGVIDQKIINPHDLCYQCSEDGPDLLFGKLIIGDCIYEPCFPAKWRLLSYQIKVNKFLRMITKKKKEIQYKYI